MRLLFSFLVAGCLNIHPLDVVLAQPEGNASSVGIIGTNQSANTLASRTNTLNSTAASFEENHSRCMELNVTLAGQLTPEDEEKIAEAIVDTYNSISCPNSIIGCDFLHFQIARFIRSTGNGRSERRRDLLGEGDNTDDEYAAEVCFVQFLWELINGCNDCPPSPTELPDDPVPLLPPVTPAPAFITSFRIPVTAPSLRPNNDGGSHNNNPRGRLFAGRSSSTVSPVTRNSFLKALKPAFNNIVAKSMTVRSLVPKKVREVKKCDDGVANDIPGISFDPAPIQDPPVAIPVTEGVVLPPTSPDKEEPKETASILFCFAGSDMVTTPHGQVPLKDLNVGDLVSNGSGFERIYSFGHYDPTLSTVPKNAFLNIYTTNDALIPALTVSKDHMIFLHEENDDNNYPLLLGHKKDNQKVLPASHVKVGDRLVVVQNSKKPTKDHSFVPTIVSRIEDTNVVPQGGIFAPFTPSGKILVNGILASNYVDFVAHHRRHEKENKVNMTSLFLSFSTVDWLAHLLMTPWRLVCQINFDWCRHETYTSDGISTPVSFLHSFGVWFLEEKNYNDSLGVTGINTLMMIVKWMILMLLVVITGVLRLVELYPTTMMVLVGINSIVGFHRLRGVSQKR